MATIYHHITRKSLYRDQSASVSETLMNAISKDVDLSGALLKDMVFHGNMQGAQLGHARFERCRLYGRATGCDFSGASFHQSDLSTFRAYQSRFNHTTWKNSKWQMGYLDPHSSLSYSKSVNSSFTHTPLTTEQISGISWDHASRNTLEAEILLLSPLSQDENLHGQLVKLTGDGWSPRHFKNIPERGDLKPQGVIQHVKSGAMIYIPEAGMGGSLEPYEELRHLFLISQHSAAEKSTPPTLLHYLKQSGLVIKNTLTPLGKKLLEASIKQVELAQPIEVPHHPSPSVTHAGYHSRPRTQ